MRSVYVSATKQDTGKTTIMLGLVQALREAGCDVGYMKPVGQRYVKFEGHNVDEDAVLARQVFGLTDDAVDMSPIAIEQGFTEKYIFNPDPKPLERRIMESWERLRRKHDVLAIEGTGHAGVGSCFDLSNARVARMLGTPVIIIVEGGIGKAIDEVSLSLHLFEKHGVEVLGVILNKVWPEKIEKVRNAVAEGLKHLGTTLIGAVPLRPSLGMPRMEQLVEIVKGRVVCGERAMDNRVESTVVAAMSPEHVCSYIKENTLVVTPGDRVDNILVATVGCPMNGGKTKPISGLVLTGGFELPPAIEFLLETADIPVILCQEDTFTVASRLKEMKFKIRPEDADKIDEAKRLIGESMDVAALVERLRK